MRKYIIHFMMLCSCFFQLNTAKADFWDAWVDEDEEEKIKVSTGFYSKSSNNSQTKTSRAFQQNNYQNPATLRTTIKQTTVYPQTVSAQQTYQNNQYLINPMEGNRNNTNLRNPMTNNNNDNYNFIDYDTIQAERNIRDAEVLNSVDKWQLGLKNVYWENYRGNNIRIEVLRSNRDLKEMRLKFVQSQDIISDPDGSISDMLNKVAEQVMKRTCGKKSKQSIILYERPSIELVKETSYDNYKIVAKGTSLKEYGFRCIY